MSDKPIIFLSSPIRPLRDLRNAAAKHLKTLGYDVIVAEDDIVAPPGQNLADICISNVDACNILVLILDGHYGTPVDGEWLVRSEFLHAKRQAKPVYVLLQRDARHAYELAKDHLDQDPATYGIHNKVVDFLDEIHLSGMHWVHEFDTVQDLNLVLKKQLLAYFSILLKNRSEALLIRTAHLLEQMHNLYRQGNYVQSLLAAEQVLRVDRDNSEALLTRSVCRIRLHGLTHRESIDKGIEDCKKVLASDKKNYRAQYNLANFKLLSPEFSTEDVTADLLDLFREFPEYEYYFNNDTEFKRMLDLRRIWSSPPPA